jgi:hypothetical protein
MKLATPRVTRENRSLPENSTFGQASRIGVRSEEGRHLLVYVQGTRPEATGIDSNAGLSNNSAEFRDGRADYIDHPKHSH